MMTFMLLILGVTLFLCGSLALFQGISKQSIETGYALLIGAMIFFSATTYSLAGEYVVNTNNAWSDRLMMSWSTVMAMQPIYQDVCKRDQTLCIYLPKEQMYKDLLKVWN